jgi:hypothetical protein
MKLQSTTLGVALASVLGISNATADPLYFGGANLFPYPNVSAPDFLPNQIASLDSGIVVIKDIGGNTVCLAKVLSAVHDLGPALNPLGGMTFTYVIQNVSFGNASDPLVFFSLAFGNWGPVDATSLSMAADANVPNWAAYDGAGLRFAYFSEPLFQGDTAAKLVIHTSAPWYRRGFGGFQSGTSGDPMVLLPDGPVAICKDVEVCNDPGFCTAAVSPDQFDGGSRDPDGGSVSLSVDPEGPYPVGVTVVSVTVTDANGVSATCEATVTVNDCEAPEAFCIPTTNPAGGNIPNAGVGQGSSPRSGQNPDGFYELGARDNCDVSGVQIWVKDSAEGPCGGIFAAGPYAPGTKVKLTQSPGQASVKPMAGVIVAHINTKGEPVLVVVDAAGNTDTCQKCFVPPLPK